MIHSEAKARSYFEGEKIYEQRLVGFVDILGWSEACEVESLRLAEAAELIHRAAQDHSDREKNRIRGVKNALPNPMYMAVQVGAFSDCIAVSMPAGFGYRIFGSVTDVCRGLLRLGFLTRGGITVGNVHHVENVIFGPALVEAVRLEKEAVYPRIVCSSGLLNFLATYPYDEREKRIVVDHLGRKVANLFSFGADLSPIRKMDRTLADELWRVSHIEEVINGQIEKFSAAKLEKLAEKWRYMRDVLPVMLSQFQQ